MPNEAIEAIAFASTTDAQPMTRTCRKLTVGHSLTPDDVDDLRDAANWMEGASIIIMQAGVRAIEDAVTPDDDDSLLSIEGFDGGGRMDVLVGPDDLVDQLSVGDRKRLVAALHRVM